MTRLISIPLTMLLMSLYLFPIEFRFLPGINTKMILALFGLFIFIFNLPKRRESGLSSNMFKLTIIALLVSFCGLASITYNNTPDTAYATYIISMWVWVGGAYCVAETIRKTHGNLSVVLIVNYLTAVAVFQCASAILLDSYPAIDAFFSRYINLAQESLKEIKRIYGFGASLDTAGVRFSAILVALTCVIIHVSHSKISRTIWIYIISFIFISVVGNIIARTTTVGVGLSFIIIAIHIIRNRAKTGIIRSSKVFVRVLIVGTAGILLCIFLYDYSEVFYKHMRFGFEGFFSLIEKGTWEVSSNDKLATMYVYPETWKTWLIGDGYFSNPYDIDPHYTGEYIEGYYMGTDVGYLRFIFYFGMTGLACFTWFFIVAGKMCMKIAPTYRTMFIFLIICNFAIWFKVATDILCIFALFLMLNPGEDDRFNKRILPMGSTR